MVIIKKCPKTSNDYGMTRNYSRETGSMTGIFEELKREIL